MPIRFDISNEIAETVNRNLRAGFAEARRRQANEEARALALEDEARRREQALEDQEAERQRRLREELMFTGRLPPEGLPPDLIGPVTDIGAEAAAARARAAETAAFNDPRAARKRRLEDQEAERQRRLREELISSGRLAPGDDLPPELRSGLEEIGTEAAEARAASIAARDSGALLTEIERTATEIERIASSVEAAQSAMVLNEEFDVTELMGDLDRLAQLDARKQTLETVFRNPGRFSPEFVAGLLSDAGRPDTSDNADADDMGVFIKEAKRLSDAARQKSEIANRDEANRLRNLREEMILTGRMPRAFRDLGTP